MQMAFIGYITVTVLVHSGSTTYTLQVTAFVLTDFVEFIMVTTYIFRCSRHEPGKWAARHRRSRRAPCVTVFTERIQGRLCAPREG